MVFRVVCRDGDIRNVCFRLDGFDGDLVYVMKVSVTRPMVYFMRDGGVFRYAGGMYAVFNSFTGDVRIVSDDSASSVVVDSIPMWMLRGRTIAIGTGSVDDGGVASVDGETGDLVFMDDVSLPLAGGEYHVVACREVDDSYVYGMGTGSLTVNALSEFMLHRSGGVPLLYYDDDDSLIKLQYSLPYDVLNVMVKNSRGNWERLVNTESILLYPSFLEEGLSLTLSGSGDIIGVTGVNPTANFDVGLYDATLDNSTHKDTVLFLPRKLEEKEIISPSTTQIGMDTVTMGYSTIAENVASYTEITLNDELGLNIGLYDTNTDEVYNTLEVPVLLDGKTKIVTYNQQITFNHNISYVTRYLFYNENNELIYGAQSSTNELHDNGIPIFYTDNIQQEELDNAYTILYGRID